MLNPKRLSDNMEATDYCFSFFRKPIQNTEPLRAIGIVDVYRYVVGHYARPQTEALRSMASPADAKRRDTRLPILTIVLSPVFSVSGMKRN